MHGFIDGEDLVLKAPPDTPTIKAIVTPGLAAHWLGTEVRNRPLQKVSMRAYRADMAAGRWAYTATPICFDWDGHLIDGKNRLTALSGIAMANFCLPFAVARGLDPDSQMFMDQGARRTAGQQLGLKGIASGSAIAAGVKMALLWEREQMFCDRWGTKDPVTSQEVVEWAQEHPDMVSMCQRNLFRQRRIGLRPSSGLAFVIRVGMVMPEEVDLFMDEMYKCELLQPGSPTLAFALRLARVNRTANMFMSDTDQLAFLIRTWNAWVGGKSKTNFIAPSGGFNAENFPKVEGL